MELQDLLRHVADNIDAQRAAGNGLTYFGAQSASVWGEEINFGDFKNYSLAPIKRTLTISVDGVEIISREVVSESINTTVDDIMKGVE